MKDTIATLIQSQMDKTTTEQFWAVSALTGFSALVLIEYDSITTHIHPYAIIIVQLVLLIYGIYYLIHRHNTYYKLEKERSEIFKEYPDAPETLKKYSKPSEIKTWTGTFFYVLWILIASSAVICTYIIG